MKTIHVEKYVNDALEESFSVPAAFVRMLSLLLPASALVALKEKGFDVGALQEAVRTGTAFRETAEVEEKGVLKRIVVSFTA